MTAFTSPPRATRNSSYTTLLDSTLGPAHPLPEDQAPSPPAPAQRSLAWFATRQLGGDLGDTLVNARSSGDG